MKRLNHLFLALLLIGLAQALYAEEFRAEEALRSLKEYEIKLNQNSSEASLERALTEVTSYYQEATQCVDAANAELSSLEKPLEVIGEQTKGESDEITQQRRILERQKSDAENALSECQLLIIHADALGKSINRLLQDKRADKLLSGRYPIWQLITNISDLNWYFDFDYFVDSLGLESVNEVNPWFLMLALGVGAMLGLLLWWRGQQRTELVQAKAFSKKLMVAVIVNLTGLAIPLLILTTLSLYLLLVSLYQQAHSLLALFIYGCFVYAWLLFLNRVLLNPVTEGGRPVVSLPSTAARAVRLRLDILAAVLLISYLVYLFLWSQPISIQLLYLGLDVLVTILVLDLIWLVWLVGRISDVRKSFQLLKAIFIVILIGILMTQWFGFRYLSQALLVGLLKTIGILFVFWLVMNFVRDFFHGIAEGQQNWQQKFRNTFGLEPNREALGLYWLYIVLSIVLWSGVIIILLATWGMPETTLISLYRYSVDGFNVGNTTIIPFNILYGVFIFTLILILFSWIKDQLVKRSLIRTGVERGAREAVISITGYVSFILATIIGLTVAGVSFSNLALIAGALSVGIGFGLQNVVNNFVSGIILLFERPVKTGDWIVVGETEGYVKKISIRSTVIQTFDRSDVIVPNSEMISNQVTNWMLKEHFGRINIDIGVAYGSDTGLVRDVLVEVAKAHPEVITNGITPDPDVLFLSFGESALKFRLRAHIFNIDDRWKVSSDLNFAIDKVFREHEIKIPFPQREIHIAKQDKI